MATTYRHRQNSVTERLLAQPAQFEFFQAVRLLKRLVATKSASRLELKVAPGLMFPDRQVTAISCQQTAEHTSWICETPMLGLIGPLGALPPHYTEQVLNQVRHKETQLRDFLSWFEQRSLELFYQVWQKNRVYIQLEANPYQDSFTRGLQCLSGTQTLTQQTQQPIEAASVCYYAGFFSRPVRSAEALRLLLQSYFQVTIAITEQDGRWLNLDAEQHTCLPNKLALSGKNNRLGQSAALGTRSWECQSQLEITVGPLTQVQYATFLPGQAKHKALRFLTKLYLGLEFSVNFRLVLAAEDFAAGRLGGAQLGWTAWTTQAVISSDKDDLLLTGDLA